jgi:hypothetical protein
VIRTITPDGNLNLSYGSCRVSVPHEPPFTLAADAHKRGYERDALQALALRMMREPHEGWPDALLLLGDQIYADEVSEGALDFIRSRRDTNEPPGEQVADFEEYTRLYWDAWRDPVTRWLLSTVPTAMIFDDHDVNDDWNISETWVRQMRSKPWWEERIIGAFMSYWVYQHLGNLSPRELEEDRLFENVQEAGKPARILREFAYKVDREIAGTRWSQSASSPLQNPLGLPERLAMRFGWTERGRRVGEALSRLTGVEEPGVHWHLLHEAPWFHNHISSLEIRGRKALLKVEKTIPENNDEPVLYPVLEHRLA